MASNSDDAMQQAGLGGKPLEMENRAPLLFVWIFVVVFVSWHKILLLYATEEVIDYLTYGSHGSSGWEAENLPNLPRFEDHTKLNETSGWTSSPLVLIFIIIQHIIVPIYITKLLVMAI